MNSLLNISKLSQKQLLSTRVCDLRLDLNRPFIKKVIDQLYAELDSKGLEAFKPDIYLGDDWFSPEGTQSISIPFYLAHSKLQTLEKKFKGVVEGGTHDWAMKLLRHEMGHCIDHRFALADLKSWQRLFGDPAKYYNPERYAKDVDSLEYVKNLPDYYAQSHPVEDFAETFAVWLDPKSNWQIQYKEFPKALQKLNYIDRIISKHSSQTFSNKAQTVEFFQLNRANRLRRTINQHYKL